MKILSFTITFLGVAGFAQATEYHVARNGHNKNAGSEKEPFLTIQYAAGLAQPGDVITVHEGVYRERINPPRGGTSREKPITYQAAQGEEVVIKGSEIVKGWQRVQGNSWKVVLPNSFFGDFNPYTDVIGGEWYRTPADGYDRHTGAVYLNGNWLDEAASLEQVLSSRKLPANPQPDSKDTAPDVKTANYPGNAIDGTTEDRPLWMAEVDEENTTIWAQFHDVDPNEETVEINVRQSIFYPDKPGRDYITVRGFTMRHAATPWSGAMSEQIGLIGTHWSRGWIIEENVISHSMNTGITLGRYDLGKFGIAMPPATAPGFVRSCELAMAHGWSRERIGSHTVRNNHISHCEKNGIHGSLGGIFSTIEGNTICDIAMRGWIRGADLAGLKLLASVDVVISHNHFYRCRGSGGVWLDWMAQGTRVTGNLLHDNSQDIFMEVNHGPFLIDNNLFLSGNVIRDWSQGAAYAHNLMTGRIVSRQEERRTPHFKPHTVDGMKLSNIKHKDARYYNNLFVGGCRPPSGDTTPNLQSAGNAYLQGPGIELEETANGVWIKLSRDTTGATRKRSVVTTELLGKAEIPGAPFEQPDGTPYAVDTDYFGKTRDVKDPAPGPFERTGSGELTFRVWPK